MKMPANTSLHRYCRISHIPLMKDMEKITIQTVQTHQRHASVPVRDERITIERGWKVWLNRCMRSHRLARLRSAKHTGTAKNTGSDQIEGRRDWSVFFAFARMRVWNSGGPIHAPHERTLKLLISPWHGGDESWTVYRHQTDAGKDGKIVFKKWNREVDLDRFRSLGAKDAREDWRKTASISEKQFSVPGRWVRALERRVEEILIPAIAGRVRPLPRETEYELRLWRNTQRSEFSWRAKPPPAWSPLTRFFFAFLETMREHDQGAALPPVDRL